MREIEHNPIPSALAPHVLVLFQPRRVDFVADAIARFAQSCNIRFALRVLGEQDVVRLEGCGVDVCWAVARWEIGEGVGEGEVAFVAGGQFNCDRCVRGEWAYLRR